MVHRHGRLILMVLALTFVLAACAPASAQPTASPSANLTPTAAPAITPDAAQPLVLVLPALYDDQKTLIAANRHYSDAIKRKGWNVEFYTVQSNDANGTDAYLPYVNKQICSGAARADGFICMQSLSIGTEDPLLEAKASGQLYDCVAAAPQVIPQYWAKYHDQITAGRYGLVLASQQKQTFISDPVLVVRKDVLPLVGKGLSEYDGLRVLMDQLDQAHLEKAYVQVYPQQLLSLWTKEQGYLELFSDAGIYARIDDHDAKPVLLEDIPGFTAFFQYMVDKLALGFFHNSYNTDTYLESYHTSSDGEEAFGPAAAVEYTYNLLYNYSPKHESWKGYTAFPLRDNSSYASDIPEALNVHSISHDMLRELIIPARSRRAADAMAFLQWLYEDRHNADAVIFGQEGEDYALQGERVQMIGSAAPQDTQSMPSWQQWPGLYLLQFAFEQRVMADAPENAESLLGNKPTRPLAATWLAHMPNIEAWGKLMSRESTDSRQNAMQTLWSLVLSSPVTRVDVEPFLKLLRAGATDSVLQPYLDVLAEARAAAQP